MSDRIAPDDWDRFVRETLADRWLDAYRAATDWTPELLEIALGECVYLFDAAPTLRGSSAGEDRVVATWGRSSRPTAPRDRSRMAGFLPGRAQWADRGRDRGHLIAHGAGGGLDINLVPQVASLNRGRSPQGKRWRALERYAAERPGTPLFVRPVYADGTWVSSAIEFGLLRDGALHTELFTNEQG
jgi:hypothetical protein